MLQLPEGQERDAWPGGAARSLSFGKCHCGVVNFWGGWWEPEILAVKVLETCMKTTVKILGTREYVIPGLGVELGRGCC